ncbi:MAG: 2-isopropylmalate synthase [Gammaproteobacteria bacterium]|nr:2-isopropylmalate synthase [Gammaproteobacteria bacterium]NNC96812.1 2-isopropylmalate synthase [Gammaproteobacteria bacterium]
MNTVKIFDTTLRDGEQSPGCSMNIDEKLKIAHALDELGVDIIEAGFPAASPGDFSAVHKVASLGLKSTICGLARSQQGDIESVAKALEPAPNKRLHVFIATSPLHRQYKLQMEKDQILQSIEESVTFARQYFDDIEFSAEDAGRTELDFLAEAFQVAVSAGATTLNIPDTVGYTTPTEFANIFRHIKSTLAGRDDIILSSHCHNDLGLAVANSLAAIEAGARQVECTINGIGERAGNAALEEVVMALKTRKPYYGVDTTINTKRLHPTSRLVSLITGSSVQANKAIVGRNAFAHEAGIHQHGMLKNRNTYEIMQPEDVGIEKTSLVLGKHSGRHAFRERLQSLGISFDENNLNDLFKQFKQLADRKKDITDEDLEFLVLGKQAQSGPWELFSLQVQTTVRHGQQNATAIVEVLHKGKPVLATADGDGPVNAVINAMRKAMNTEIELFDYRIQNISIGDDAQGEVKVSLSIDGQQRNGSGASTDIVEATALAVINCINRECKRQKQNSTELYDDSSEQQIKSAQRAI